MTATSDTSVQRKMASARDEPLVEGRTALRALRLGLARAARDTIGLPIAVIGASQTRFAQEQLTEHLDEERMLLLLDGPDRAVGAVCVDRSTLIALIQQQTMGRVTDGDPGERPFTTTDAAMVAPLIDAMIKRSTDLCEFEPDKKCLEGFRFGALTPNFRALILAVEAERFRIFELQLDFAAGMRQGAMTLVLPDEVPGVKADAAMDAARSEKMQRAIGPALAELNVIIGRIKLPLAELSRLAPDDLIPLVDPQLGAAELVAIDGRKVATGRLGQSGGLKAVRINTVGARQMRHVEDSNAFELSALSASSPDEEGVTLDMPALGDFPTPDLDGEGFGAMADLPDPEAMPDLAPMPDLPDAGNFPAMPDAMDFPAMDTAGEEIDLPDMSNADAAAEISALAGLSSDDEADFPTFTPPE